MEDFLNYLSSIKTILGQDNGSLQNIHIVIGNESCDLDSCVSALSLAYYLHKRRTLCIPEKALVVPVQNVTREEFLLRSENCLVLRKLGIQLDVLVYRDEINLSQLLLSKTITTSLVDHHTLSQNDKELENTVKQIFDHRPLDTSNKWNKEKVQIRIEEVGSCSTLVGDEILKNGEQYLFKELAYLLYQSIVFDTIALLPENGKAKKLDLFIAKQLEDKFDLKEERKIVFDRLWEAHNDVLHLMPKQLLIKDLKIVDNVPVPGLPMLVQNFLNLDGSNAAISKFADEKKATVIVLVGLETKNEVLRDVGIYYTDEGKHFRDILLRKLQCCDQPHGYDFEFSEVKTSYCNIICLKQNNIKLSRKQIIAVIKAALLDLA